jgi:3-oxoacyl-[acyl-carrier protein] reductase
MNLKGKNVLVTGGSKGIGRAIVEAMAKQGANVIINYSSDADAADKFVSEIANYPVKVLAIKANVADDQEVNAMFDTIAKEFSSIDVLVNNAGIFDNEDGPDNLEAFSKVFDIDFLAQVRVTNATRKLMSKGKIVFISSIHGRLGHGGPQAIAYSAMKAALDSYMKNLAKALAPDIIVNSIAPGRTITPMWGDMDDAYKAKMASGHLINRWIEPSEIADGVVFLAKNDAVCGEVLTIDGGMSLKSAADVGGS